MASQSFPLNWNEHGRRLRLSFISMESHAEVFSLILSPQTPLQAQPVPFASSHHQEREPWCLRVSDRGGGDKNRAGKSSRGLRNIQKNSAAATTHAQ